MKLLFGKINPLAVLDLQESKKSPEGYKTIVNLQGGSSWQSRDSLGVVQRELEQCLSSLYPEPKVIHVQAPVFLPIELKPHWDDVRMLRTWLESGKPYVTMTQREALIRVLDAISVGTTPTTQEER